MKNDKDAASVSPERIAEECVAVRLRILTRAVTRIYNDALRPHGLTVSQMNILVAVSCLGKAKQQDVCNALHLEKSSLSRDLKRMLAQGWLDTLAGEDGRSARLRVTASGKKLLKEATPAWHRAQQRAMSLLGEKEIAGIQRAARAVRAARTKNLL